MRSAILESHLLADSMAGPVPNCRTGWYVTRLNYRRCGGVAPRHPAGAHSAQTASIGVAVVGGGVGIPFGVRENRGAGAC